MKVRKKLSLSQLDLVTKINMIICEQNPNMQCEFDLTMMNPVIAAVNQMIKDLHRQGECLFSCDCEGVHDPDCSLVDDEAYDVKVKYAEWYDYLKKYIDYKGQDDLPMSYTELKDKLPVVQGVFKAVLTELLEERYIYRDDEDWFYKV